MSGVIGKSDIVIVGAGIFGITSALELNRRGYEVAVVDPGPIPHPLASSTDISKAVRMEYGTDVEYVTLAEQARDGWLDWNEQFQTPLYREVGLAMLTRAPMSPGGFEYESYHLLRDRGHQLERLNATEIVRCMPAWKPGAYLDGYFNPHAGYAISGRVVEHLVDRAQRMGVRLHTGRTASEVRRQGQHVGGIRTQNGDVFVADHTVISAGAWTPSLVPDLQRYMNIVGQPVFHLKPSNAELFEPPHFFVFGADVSRTGWYGFPLHPTEGVVKIANHGPGETLDPSADDRVVRADDIERLRQFLHSSMPALAAAPVLHTRRCLYCDTLDEHLWIARHPLYAGLTVAAGGSGHAFKFAPVLGALIADAVEGKSNPYSHKFAWRELALNTAGEEGTRYHGD